MSTISLTPEGGLCNRMRSIASVWLLAKAVKKPLTVQWLLTDDMNCSFGQLFDESRIEFKVVEHNAIGLNGKAMKFFRTFSERSSGFSGRTFLDPNTSAKLAFDLPSLTKWANSQSPTIRTNSKMLNAPGMFSIFAPHPRLQRIVNEHMPRLRNSIGVHIRRSDNTKSAQFSSLHSFVSLMEAELTKSPDVSFFVATDSPESFSDLRNRFGDAVFQHTKTSLQRSDPLAIHDAVIDLYCLANCRKLIGSYWSSFSDTAWEIRGIDHHIVHDEVVAAS